MMQTASARSICKKRETVCAAGGCIVDCAVATLSRALTGLVFPEILQCPEAVCFHASDLAIGPQPGENIFSGSGQRIKTDKQERVAIRLCPC